MMKRALSVWMPGFAIEALRRRERGRTRDDRPVLLVREERQRRVVAACCERAARAGVEPGIPVAEARALVRGGVRIEESQPARDGAMLHRLAVWAMRFSPVVAVDEPDGLLLDVSGCSLVFGGEEKLLAALMEGLSDLGFSARAAAAPTFGCAWAVARFGRRRVSRVPEGMQRRAMETLPVAALGIDDEAVQALAEVGVERVGEVLDLPRSVLPARFGDELLLRVDRALGQAIERIDAVRPTEPVGGEIAFDGPTTHIEAIEGAVRQVLNEIAAGLQQREEGATRVELELGRSDMPAAKLSIMMSRASRSGKHLWELVRPKVERVHLGFGVERVSAVACRSVRMGHEQAERWREGAARASAEASAEAGRVMDVLANRLGRERVCVARLRESHMPECAFAMRSVLDGGGGEGERAPGLRPTVLLECPMEVQVTALTPDGPVRRVRVGGVEHEAVRSVGPERISPAWWMRGDRPPKGFDFLNVAERDYFRVQLECGSWVWLCGVGEKWFIHGVW